MRAWPKGGGGMLQAELVCVTGIDARSCDPPGCASFAYDDA